MADWRIDHDQEAFFKYSAQRWAWNEPEQLSRRYIKFNVDALVSIAQKAVGNGAVCVDITRLPEGNFSKVFLATMKDGQQLVVKIPNPNAGPAHFTTASEVATMQFVRSLKHPDDSFQSPHSNEGVRSEKNFIFLFQRSLSTAPDPVIPSSAQNTL